LGADSVTREIRLVTVDDHPIVRKGLRDVVEAEPDLKVLAEGEDGATGLELIRSLLPDICSISICRSWMGSAWPRKSGS